MLNTNEWLARPRHRPQPLEMKTKVPELIEELIGLRASVDPGSADDLLQASLKSLSSPFLLDDMDKAVERLIEAFKKQEKICVYADFDLDGTPGLALLLTAFENLGFENVIGYQPKRLSEGYGVHKAAIDQMDISLMVTVDVGITDVEAIDFAKSKNIDVIVTDHHLPKEKLPNALAIVNPNKGTCDSGLTYLCGAGVAFYLALALRSKMKEQSLLELDFNPKDLLDVFTIGTVTDLVPLVKENRILVKHGLVALENTKRPGLRALLKSLKLDGRPLTAQDVGIRFAPKLNALSRMEAELLPIDLFTVKDESEAEELVRQMLKINERRLALQKSAEQEAFDMYKAFPQKGYAWVSSPNFHQGVIGLVATKLSQKFNVPAYVGCVHDDGTITGSSRSPQGGMSVLEGLQASESCLNRFGGHAPAAGFELSVKNVELFDKSLSTHFEAKLAGDAPKAAPIYYDCELSLDEMSPSLMKWLEHLGPFGQAFEIPIFLIKNVIFKEVRELKGAHLKFELKNNKQKLSALWFFPPKEALKFEYSSDRGYDLLVEAQWNYFAGRKTIQFLVKDLKESL